MKKTILSTADVARLFNVTETTVKRWADEGTLKCQKTPGGHRKFQMKHIVEFSNTQSFDPIGTLTMPEGDELAPAIELAVLKRDFKTLTNIFIQKALSPDKADLFEYFSYLYQHHVQLWEMFDFILGPGMQAIGEKWERGEIGVNHEHRASYETMEALSQLQTQVSIKHSLERSVICACIEDELHEIGLRCASYIFEAAGWEVHYLGARTPADSLIAAMKEQKPDVVCISVTNLEQNGKLRSSLAKLTEAGKKKNIQIILGGRGVDHSLVEERLCSAVYRSSHDLISYIDSFKK